MIDLRSDTVTKPTEEMKSAMWNAKVGDDVFEEDPTVNELESKIAKMFGMESALFAPSGTMTNQIAIKVHTVPGDEVICSRESHIYCYEGGGIASNSGASVRLIPGESGLINATQVKAEINDDNVHFPRTTLVSLENTSNRGGGCCYNFDEILKISKVCKENNLKLHLDGARLFNAIVANNESPVNYGNAFDSISICLSKGLGTPVGSVLLGTKDFIKQARRVRKVFGGGMRQAGYLAAAGIYALDNHIERLANDHKSAKLMAEAANLNSDVKEVMPVETNIVVIILNEGVTNTEFLNRLEQKGVRAVPFGPRRVRLVTHLDLSQEDINTVCDLLPRV